MLVDHLIGEACEPIRSSRKPTMGDRDVAGDRMCVERRGIHRRGLMTKQQFDPAWNEFRQVVANTFGTQVERVERDVSFFVDLGADSLGMVRVLIELEDRYQLAISEEEAASLVTVGDAFDYVAQRMAS
jgi:acyl carrier protein